VPLGTALRREQVSANTYRNRESASYPEGSGDEGEAHSHINSEFSSGSSGSREPCTCGFCDGFEVEYSETDPHSGEVEDHSFKKASQVERCPRCGGINFEWRQRYIAHCAAVGRRLGRKRHVYFVSFLLRRSDADEADLSTEKSYEVLMDQWDRVRRQLNRRAENVDYTGVVVPRPSDERYHGHLLIFTSLTRHELMRAFHTRGIDAYIQMPKDDADDPESFAARKGAYAWENAASSSDSQQMSSQGNGVGYNSKAARQRRRKAVNMRDDDAGEETPNQNGEPSPSDPNPSLSWNGRSGNGGEGQGKRDLGGGDPDPNRGNGHCRAPPVDCGGGHFPDLGAALAAAKAAFIRRVGTRVPVVDKGSAELLKVYREGDSLACVIAPEGRSITERVPWNQAEVVNSPKIRPGSSDPTDGSNDRNKDRGGSDSGGEGGSSGSGPKGGSTPSDNGDGGSDGDGSTPDGDGPDEEKDDPDGDDGGGENGSSDGDGDSGGDDGGGSKDDDSGSDEDPGERFREAADKSVVQIELPDERRLKTTFNYDRGEARASVLPPRHSPSD